MTTDREPSTCAVEAGGTRLQFPLGGVASTDPSELRAPLIRPFWLLAGMVGVGASVLVGVRLLLR